MPDWLASIVSFIGTDKFSILNFAVLAVIVIAIFGAISSYIEKYLTTSVGQWVMHDLRRVLYSHIQKLSLSYHDRKRTGDLISRVTSDIDAVQSLISNVLLGMLVNVLTLIGMVVVMLYLNWMFTLIALLVAPGLFLVVYHYTHRIKKASRAMRRQEGEVVNVLEEVLSWVRSLPGSQRLRALIVFDEVYGFLPPHPQNPPTKRPLVALMKQARGFGVGIVVATQNPMDLDYRALSNAGGSDQTAAGLQGRAAAFGDGRRRLVGLHDDR